MALTGRQRAYMRKLARRNYLNAKRNGVDLKRDYDNVTPPPHGKPFDNIRAVWGIQASGRDGFVIDESDLPY